MNEPTLTTLRHYAVRRALPRCTSIEQAVERLGFVQADPIRAPARAQDLILGQRVDGYRAGDLERRYPDLPLEEDMLHVYGFLPQRHAPLLHPRPLGPRGQEFLARHRPIQTAVLRYLGTVDAAHPRQVEQALGKRTAQNAWGGTSAATTLMLETLHRLGQVRVVRRESGQRVYALVPPRGRALGSTARAEGLARLVATLYAPMPERSLRQVLGALRAPTNPHPRKGLDRLLARGELRRHHIAGEAWIWPADEPLEQEAEDRVRLLAPFDPVVWDRRRFSLLWDWEYRFEAYTPAARRRLGYYALPLLWRERVIGWANAERTATGLHIQPGYIGTRPRERAYARALEEEVARLHLFLGLPPP
jgi:uncharacterized protein YcaQ